MSEKQKTKTKERKRQKAKHEHQPPAQQVSIGKPQVRKYECRYHSALRCAGCLPLSSIVLLTKEHQPSTNPSFKTTKRESAHLL